MKTIGIILSMGSMLLLAIQTGTLLTQVGPIDSAGVLVISAFSTTIGALFMALGNKKA
jgi:hypothetical protein